MHNFAYHMPKSIAEAAELVASLETPEFLAGGQSLLPAMKDKVSAPSDLVKLSGLLSKKVEKNDNKIVIGAGITHAELAEHPEIKAHLPSLASLAAQVGDPQVRNRGTLGGSLAANVPAGDYQAACWALDAEIHTQVRSICTQDFFTGAGTCALEKGEIITSVAFTKTSKAGFKKILDPAARSPLVGVFVAALPDGPRVSVSGARPTGAYRHEAAEVVLAKDFSEAAVANIETPEAEMMSSLYADKRYRAHLVNTLIRQVVGEC